MLRPCMRGLDEVKNAYIAKSLDLSETKVKSMDTEKRRGFVNSASDSMKLKSLKELTFDVIL